MPALPPPPGKPPVSSADLTISIVALVLTVMLGAVGAFFGIFSLAFLDYCPPASCSAEGAATAVMTAVGVAALVGLGGLVVTIIQFVRRKIAWPFAVGALVLCVVVFFIGGVGYVAAVGG
jgi:hypothetical protein